MSQAAKLAARLHARIESLEAAAEADIAAIQRALNAVLSLRGRLHELHRAYGSSAEAPEECPACADVGQNEVVQALRERLTGRCPPT